MTGVRSAGVTREAKMIEDDYEERQRSRVEAEERRRWSWGNGVYDEWKGYAPDPGYLGDDPDAYYDGYYG